MARYHVKADGAMGVCTAQEGHCPFGVDAGVKHFTSESEAQAYAEKIIRDTTDHNGGMKKMKENKYGLAVTTYPTTEHGVHWAAYPGWVGDDVIIQAGGYVDGVYISPSEVETHGLYDQLSEDVRDEMEPLRGDWPGNWNGKIIELKGNVSPRDEELLEALWISGEVYDGEVTVYGDDDDDVSEMNDVDFHSWGLDRIATDDDDEEDEDEDEDEDEESPTNSDSDDDDEPRMTTNQWGLKVTTWPTERGVHSATYLGWDGPDTIINAGGWISGEYIAPTDEIGLNRAWESLPEDVRDEMADCTPVEWNSKILELEKSGDLSPEDEALLEAFWTEGEVFGGSVTIYGRDDDVSGLDEDDLKCLGLRRLDADELWHMGIVDDDDDDDDEDE